MSRAEEQLREMLDRAWGSLSPEQQEAERAERELWFQASSRRGAIQEGASGTTSMEEMIAEFAPDLRAPKTEKPGEE